MKTLLLLILLAVGVRADVLVYNYRAESADVEGTSVAANSSATVTNTASTVKVLYGSSLDSAQVVEVVDGTVISVGQNGVTAGTPLSSWIEIFVKGFFTACVWEAFGLLLRTVRAVKSTTGDVL